VRIVANNFPTPLLTTLIYKISLTATLMGKDTRHESNLELMKVVDEPPFLTQFVSVNDYDCMRPTQTNAGRSFRIHFIRYTLVIRFDRPFFLRVFYVAVQALRLLSLIWICRFILLSSIFKHHTCSPSLPFSSLYRVWSCHEGNHVPPLADPSAP